VQKTTTSQGEATSVVIEGSKPPLDKGKKKFVVSAHA